MKYKAKILFLLLFIASLGFAQQKEEREFRIDKEQFPKNALQSLEPQLMDARRVRYYKEIDGDNISYEIKFKKRRAFYSVEFNEQGVLEDIEFVIKKIEIPEASYDRMNAYLKKHFEKFRIKKIQQQYPCADAEDTQSTIYKAFQNLLIEGLNYEIVVSGKKQKEYRYYELLFDAEGNFLLSRELLSTGYEHVLY
ncbi:hypothetical protein ACFQ1M_02280 [Sungkyunkwania multivorans]|uniref:PepSY domain-containing protein n=1 Tax=Sungkyunkwania multivorans TaxID=1173618 RepID=A0ABW3CVD9_9FLAO